MSDHTVLFDLNNIANRTFFLKAVDPEGEEPKYELWKSMMFAAIMEFLDTQPQATRVIVAVDSKRSWRHLMYPPYKGDRGKKRDRLNVNWDRFYAEYNEFIARCRVFLPFYTLKVELCEADDIIAWAALNLPGHCTVVSSDSDFTQLQLETPEKRINVYDLHNRRFREPTNVEQYLNECYLMGQSKDNIYNVLTPTDFEPSETQKRKPGFGEVAAAKVLASDGGNLIAWAHREGVLGNFLRNRALVNLRMIPEFVNGQILAAFYTTKLPDRRKVCELFETYNWLSFIPKQEMIAARFEKLN